MENIEVIHLRNRQVNGAKLCFFLHYGGAAVRHPDHPVHRHAFYEICYVTGGRGLYQENESEYELAQGNLIFTRPGVWHQITQTGQLGLLWLAFELDTVLADRQALAWFQRIDAGGRSFIGGLASSPIPALWQMLLDPARMVHELSDDYEQGLIGSLLIACLQSFAPDRNNSDVPDSRSPKNESYLLHQARQYVRENLSNPIHLQHLAEHLHISIRHLTRIFMEETGGTFAAFLRSERIYRARTLLKMTLRSIEQIADETGFSSVNHFSRVFKEPTGSTPAKSRK